MRSSTNFWMAADWASAISESMAEDGGPSFTLVPSPEGWGRADCRGWECTLTGGMEEPFPFPPAASPTELKESPLLGADGTLGGS